MMTMVTICGMEKTRTNCAGLVGVGGGLVQNEDEMETRGLLSRALDGEIGSK